MLNIDHYLSGFQFLFPETAGLAPWEIPANIEQILKKRIERLGDDYEIHENRAIHRTAIVEQHAVLKGPMIISEKVFIGAHAYLRGGVYVGQQTVIGPGTELKSSIVLHNTALAHFNFAGDSLIGSFVNMEAGSVIANHYNERKDKTIFVVVNGQRMPVSTVKFGALVGDETRIGANAVLSPGTILSPGSVVKRLELIEQA